MTRLGIRDDRGFAMIEAVVACMLLVVIALGVLKGLDTANQSSGREKGRAVAAALTEQDQERLRSFRAVDLADYSETRTVTVNKASYTIVSRGDWIRDSTGGTASCNNTGPQADYMRVTTTTSSGLISNPIPPITMSSLVAPPAGAFGINQGTLGVQVNDRDGKGVAGISVAITGPASDTNLTNSAGCAIFPSIPVGNYSASVTEAGSVDNNGNSPGSVAGTVTNGTVSVSTLKFDKAASVAVTFDTEPRLSSVAVPTTGTLLSASNSGVTAPFAGVRTFDPPGDRVLGLTATNLFPFAAGYGLFGGGCPEADPTSFAAPAGATYFTTLPGSKAFIQTNPGALSPPAVVRLPSINVRVTQGTAAPTTRFLTAKLLITSTSGGCDEQWQFTGAAAIDANGWMVTPALPFGDYDVCASLQRTTSSEYRRTIRTDVQNRLPQGNKSGVVVDVSNSSSGSNQQCF